MGVPTGIKDQNTYWVRLRVGHGPRGAGEVCSPHIARYRAPELGMRRRDSIVMLAVLFAASQ